MQPNYNSNFQQMPPPTGMQPNYDSNFQQMPPPIGMPPPGMPPSNQAFAGAPMSNQGMGNQALQMPPAVGAGMPPSPRDGMQPHPGAVPLMPMQQQQQQQQMPAPGQQNMAGVAVITNPNATVQTAGFGNLPQNHKCQYCGHQGPTRVQHQASVGTHIAAVGSCLVCCCAVVVPYMVTDCQQANHTCTNCGQLVGEKIFLTK